MYKYIAYVVLLLCTINSVFGLYFHIAEAERKCFIEEVPDDTTVIVNYKVELHAPCLNGFMRSSSNIGMHVEVRDSDEKLILSRVYSSEDRISFTSHTPGEHVICMFSNSTAWFSRSQLRVHLDIRVGEHAIDYAYVAQREKLSEMELRIRQLLDQVEQIMKEQNYYRYKEERFTQTSENTNSRVLWCILAQTIVFVVMAFWQIRNSKFLGELQSFESTSVIAEQKIGYISLVENFNSKVFELPLVKPAKQGLYTYIGQQSWRM